MERSIEATTTLRADLQAARQVLRETPAGVFGEPVSKKRGLAPHAFRTTMPVVIGAGATIEHVVVVEVGRVPGDEQPLVVDLALHPVDHAPVLPSFDGALVVGASDDDHGPNTLTLRGAYTAPFGPLGRVGDNLVGHRIARSSMEAFAARVAQRLDEIGSARGGRSRGTR